LKGAFKIVAENRRKNSNNTRTSNGRKTTSGSRSGSAKKRSSGSSRASTSGRKTSVPVTKRRSTSNTKRRNTNTSTRSNSYRSSSARKKRKTGYVGDKKKYSEKSNMIFYVLIVALVLIIGAVVCFGFLFKAETITVVGTYSKYTSEQIISAGNIKNGDILIGINSKDTEEKLETSLAYIEDAQIKKKFPSTVLISITEAKPMAVVDTPTIRYIISDTYKVIDILSGDVPENLILINGGEVEKGTVGYKIKFKDEEFTSNINRLIKSLEKNELSVRANEMDESGYFKANYDERIIIDFGNLSNIDHKVKMAKKIIDDEIAVTDKGILYLSQENQSSFRIDTGNLGIEYEINPKTESE